MILCDTNILIEIYKDNFDIIQIAKSIGQHNIGVSHVTCADALIASTAIVHNIELYTLNTKDFRFLAVNLFGEK